MDAPESACATFAHLVPVNDQARRLFTSSFAYAQSTDGDQHLKYFGQGEHHPAMSDQDGSTSYDEEDKAVPEPHLHPGYYVFSLDKDLLPEIPAHGWRVGKGSNRGGKMVEVDILLSKPRDPRGKKLAGVHLLLHFHPRSWMFMLVAGSTQKTVEYYVNGQFKTLAFPSRHVLCEQTNRLRLGDCEYDLIYTVADHLQKGFMAYNAEVLERFGHGRYDGPSPGIQTFPPKNGFTKSGEVLICSTLSYGGQGWVFAGVEMASGEPVAVKEISVKSTKQFRQASSEWEYGKSFQGVPGLLSSLHFWCEHDTPYPCGKVPEKVFITTPLALGDFEKFAWATCPDWLTQLSLCRSTLIGIQELHKRGIMHRDISGQNLLILSLNPPEAVVCDYGKAVKAQSSTHSCLGPFEFTAPEVWLGAYDSRIDLWSWALAMAILLGYDHSSTDKITTADISNIQRYLRIRGRDDEGFEAFCRLLRHMLEADPAARPTIAEALEDGCWDAIDDDSEETEQDSDQTDTIHDTIHVKRVRVSEGSN